MGHSGHGRAFGFPLLTDNDFHSGRSRRRNHVEFQDIMCSFLAMSCMIAVLLTPANLKADASKRAANIILIESDSMDGRVMGCAGHHGGLHAEPRSTRCSWRTDEEYLLQRTTVLPVTRQHAQRSSRSSGRGVEQLQGFRR